MKSKLLGHCEFCGKSLYEDEGHYTLLDDIFCNRECLYTKIDKQAGSVDKETLNLIRNFIAVEQKEVLLTNLVMKDEQGLSQFDPDTKHKILGTLTVIRNDSEGHIKALSSMSEELRQRLGL